MKAYFLGAGASKQDRFPLTAELKHGIAWAILQEPERFEGLAAHLQYIYCVEKAVMEESARTWDRLRQSVKEPPLGESGQLPDVTDMLSTLDWMIREQSSFGPGLNTFSSVELSLGLQLSRVRDLVVQALCYCLGTYDRLDSASTTREFMEKVVRAEDSLVTTNWDLLLDAARDARFGSEPADYGTVGNVVLEGHTSPTDAVRPRLLKLHGSLSWRYCPRCQRLVIDPQHHVAGERVNRAKCVCTCQFSELIVTPGFVREYRNVHLLTIWREVMLALAGADEWVFVGYSLPADDIGIRALLLKARCVRQDIGHRPPGVTIVNRSQEVLARYRGIVPQAQLFPGDFGQYVRAASGTA